MNRSECRALGIPKTVASSIEQAEQYISEVTHWMPLQEPPKGE